MFCWKWLRCHRWHPKELWYGAGSKLCEQGRAGFVLSHEPHEPRNRNKEDYGKKPHQFSFRCMERRETFKEDISLLLQFYSPLVCWWGTTQPSPEPPRSAAGLPRFGARRILALLLQLRMLLFAETPLLKLSTPRAPGQGVPQVNHLQGLKKKIFLFFFCLCTCKQPPAVAVTPRTYESSLQKPP